MRKTSRSCNQATVWMHGRLRLWWSFCSDLKICVIGERTLRSTPFQKLWTKIWITKCIQLNSWLFWRHVNCSFSVILLIYMFGKKFFCKPICVNFANQFGFLILTKRCCPSAVTSNLFVCRFVCHFVAPRLEVSLAKMRFLKPWLLLCQFQGAQFFSILKTFSQSSSLSSHLWCKNVLCNQWNWGSKSSVYFDIFLIFSLILNAI